MKRKRKINKKINKIKRKNKLITNNKSQKIKKFVIQKILCLNQNNKMFKLVKTYKDKSI